MLKDVKGKDKNPTQIYNQSICVASNYNSLSEMGCMNHGAKNLLPANSIKL